jgi:hypothetical protein
LHRIKGAGPYIREEMNLQMVPALQIFSHLTNTGIIYLIIKQSYFSGKKYPPVFNQFIPSQ